MILICLFCIGCGSLNSKNTSYHIWQLKKYNRQMTSIEKVTFSGCSSTVIDIKRGPIHYIVVICKNSIKFIPGIGR